MIKKIMTVLSMLLLSTALTWAVWEGNAAAGSQEEFPTGLFASSDLFPKYTLIEITNLEQNITSRAVVINNEGAQGVLVKVSPDLAKILAIKEGRTVRVRVSIPPLVAEEGADPVLLGKVEERQLAPTATSETPIEETPQVSPVEAVPAEEPIQPAEEPVQEDNNRKDSYEEPIQNEVPIQNEPAPPEVSEPVKPAAEPKEEKNEKAESIKEVDPITVAEIETPVQTVQPEPEEPVSPIAEVEEPTQPEVVPAEPTAPVAEVSEPVLPEPEIVPAPAAVSEVTEPIELVPSSEYSAEAEKPVLDAPPIQKPPIEAGGESSGEYTKPVVQVAEIAVPATASELDALLSPVPEVSTPIEPEPEPVTVDEAELEKDTEEPTVEPKLPAVEPNEEPVEESKELQDEPEVVIAEEALAEKESKDDTTEDDLITENHVMLVPSEPRVPMKEFIPVPKEPEKPALPAAAPVVTQPAEELYTANVLTKGAFYVQIGRFKDMLNVESFVQRYGKQYPIAVEKSSTAQEVFYKVYVGPLKKDEQGATLETFQKLGFKDAFLKKAP
ncbi:SPOR domain-containing protein [Treponema sp. OMZ 855]|uniref:SPOR domain-containing protein n=1 Tax=Treponema sp. OMZ 855 TaxID=1643512 RepID=UPI0020A4C30C|nr:SPOR domain-containing protein [Treponema sp. OMZ 855]UTC51719.1 SPOR domain-containing protein [Treponema sp. OMZ 855]